MPETLLISLFSQWKPKNNLKLTNGVLWQNQVSSWLVLQILSKIGSVVFKWWLLLILSYVQIHKENWSDDWILPKTDNINLKF